MRCALHKGSSFLGRNEISTRENRSFYTEPPAILLIFSNSPVMSANDALERKDETFKDWNSAVTAQNMGATPIFEIGELSRKGSRYLANRTLSAEDDAVSALRTKLINESFQKRRNLATGSNLLRETHSEKISLSKAISRSTRTRAHPIAYLDVQEANGQVETRRNPSEFGGKKTKSDDFVEICREKYEDNNSSHELNEEEEWSVEEMARELMMDG